ncbi:MAG: DUF4124 domain-containing protein [Gammaproteobacteria bacterium]|nr:DUF4124 domain-containing protein [Gammaproteobacteria bacterium]
MQKLKLVACSIILFSIFSLTPAVAEQQFYRCVVNGKTTYTDKSCDAPTLPGVERSSASTSSNASGQAGKPTKSIELDYSTPYGIWRGQAQYQGTTVKGQAMPEAHVVVPLVIEVEKQGRVRGASPENGCKLLGVAAPYVAPNMLTLDVTLSECRYPALNRRYSGTLVLYQSGNSAQFSLRSLNHMVAVLIVGPSNFDIKATMKR